jgi:rhodanese-related sulfurtransferase
MKEILLMIVLFFIVWDAVWWAFGVKPLFPWQLKKKLDSASSDLLLLDVRTPMEFSWFHLPEAQNDPTRLMETGSIQDAPPDQSLVIICMTGHRSPIVAYALKKKGFRQVYNLTWGMMGWQIYKFFTSMAGEVRSQK